MLRALQRVAVVPVVFMVAACGTGQQSSSPSPIGAQAAAVTAAPSSPPPTTPSASTTGAASLDATAIAKAMRITTATKVVAITEDNDPNDLIGRPNGYESAAVIFDRQLKCPDLGADCGATIEVWPSAEAAHKRSDYIQAILKGTPILGSEYHSVKGAALLRVHGKLKPSVWRIYKSAFEAL